MDLELIFLGFCEQGCSSILTSKEVCLMIINNNISAINATRQLEKNGTMISKDMEKLSSGSRINQAADDASGLAVSEKMRSQIKGLNQAGQNIQSGMSFLQTAEGYLNETTNVLQRVRQLAVQSSNGIYSDSDRGQIQAEMNQLVSEVSRVASHAQFNGMNMLTGRFGENGTSMQIQVGANIDQNVKFEIGTMTGAALGLADMQGNTVISISTAAGAERAIGIVDLALHKVVSERSSLGAYQNRFQEAYTGVTVAAENMQASESKIRDANIAEESVNLARDQVLSQASLSMLAQANVRSQSALGLLQ
jgi:flagellin